MMLKKVKMYFYEDKEELISRVQDTFWEMGYRIVKDLQLIKEKTKSIDFDFIESVQDAILEERTYIAKKFGDWHGIGDVYNDRTVIRIVNCKLVRMKDGQIYWIDTQDFKGYDV